MHTTCSQCGAVFRVTHAQLKAAMGRVRCGQCRTVFDATMTLRATPPNTGANPTKTELSKLAEKTTPPKQNLRPPPAIPPTTVAKPKPVPVQTEQPLPPIRTARRISASDEELMDDSVATLISKPEVPQIMLDDLRTKQQQPRRGIGGSILALLLLLTLLAQFAYTYRNHIAEFAEIRPAIESICSIVGCELPPFRALDRIELLRRNVYSHPNLDAALVVDATIVSSANFPQPYPTLAISMANAKGDTVAARLFEPAEYTVLSDATPMMLPNVPINAVLELVDPGREALTFELDFF